MIYLRQQLHLKHPDFSQYPNVNAMINRDIHCNWKNRCLLRYSPPFYYWIGSMKKSKKIPEKIELCECLNELLSLELSLGNTVSHFNNNAGWPHPNTHFVMLINDLSIRLENLTFSQNISHQICRDPHYGWHDECFCSVHHDLLCAGYTKPYLG